MIDTNKSGVSDVASNTIVSNCEKDWTSQVPCGWWVEASHSQKK